MDAQLNWIRNIDKNQFYHKIIGPLQDARNKLTPIVDDVLLSAFVKNDASRNMSECSLTFEQYQNVIWASQLLNEVEYKYLLDHRKYYLPNSHIIVNNVEIAGEGKRRPNDNKKITIDENTALELLDLYEQMGVVIEKIISRRRQASNKPEEQKKALRREDDKPGPTGDKTETDTSKDDERKQPSSPRGAKPKESSPPQTKSSAMTNSSSKSREAGKPYDEDASIYIRIQCLSDMSDTEDGKRNEQDGKEEINCSKDCPSNYHIKLDGKPVTLKVNQNATENAVYCINADGEDDNDIKIVIKQCPDCRSTIISSSTRIQESPEYSTLHGTGADEDKMAYSSTTDCDCPNKKKSNICLSLSKLKCNEFTAPCPCDEAGAKKTERPSKLAVVINSDNLDKSQVKVKERGIPLTRTKVCSSMEFDVGTAYSKLRDHEIEHPNPHIVIQLKKLGVDNILKACRPAKCCRKAVLDERQKIALPYCVSLRSLPLMANDADVIKQSIEMSDKKIKNSLNLSQAQKDKLAYYVSLGRDDFKPNINFPWVVPIYDVSLNRLSDANKHKKPSECQKKPKGILKNRYEENEIKYFIMKPEVKSSFNSSHSMIDKIRKKIRKHQRSVKSTSSQFYDTKGDLFLSISDHINHICNKRNISRKIRSSVSGHHDLFSDSDSKLSQLHSKKLSHLSLFKKRNLSKYSKSMVAVRNLHSEEPFKPEKTTMKRKKKLHKSKHDSPESRRQVSRKIKKLVYYIGLVNGDLWWSQTLPLKAPNYKTYYNQTDPPDPSNTPVEEPPITQLYVADIETHQVYSRAPPSNEDQQNPRLQLSSHLSRYSTISNLVPLNANQVPQTEFPPFSMGPESTTALWAPFVVSVTSVPKIEEVESVLPPPKDKKPVQPPPDEKKPERPKSKCEMKKKCVENDCVKDCKRCSYKREAAKSCDKNCKSRDSITIAITQGKDKKFSVEGRAPPACSKEICEIYKNKLLVPDKSTKKIPQARDPQKFSFSANDNIEILINNKKILLTKTPKKAKEEKDNPNKPDAKKDNKDEKK